MMRHVTMSKRFGRPIPLIYHRASLDSTIFAKEHQVSDAEDQPTKGHNIEHTSALPYSAISHYLSPRILDLGGGWLA